MGGLDLFTVGAERFRLGSWRGEAHIGYLVPLCPPERLSSRGVERSLERLASNGFTEVLTAALTGAEQEIFRRHGFDLHERLHLLHHDLRVVPEAPAIGAELIAGRPWHRGRALAIDTRAFDPFWRLDREGLDEAIAATPARRFRVARDGATLVAYAVSGHAGQAGYLQRLAVDPTAAGQGLGRALVADALRWMRRAGVQVASVNTQEGNDRALALYERMGFRRVEPGLAVFRRALA